VSKRYLGIVNGPVRKESGTISLNLLKTSSKYGGWRMVASHEGKPAVTHWRKIAEIDGMTLVEFRPETGRTHQIRVHAQRVWAPRWSAIRFTAMARAGRARCSTPPN
jgi:tRNA pseudouridine32 synthase/23S rRNA pseudouridine746 synthase